MIGIRPGRLPMLAGLGFLAAVVIVPVGVAVGSAVLRAAGDGSLVEVLANPVTDRALANSLVQGALGTAGALALGFPAGVALARYRLPGRSLFLGLLLLAFLLPSLVMIEGVVGLFGPGGPLEQLGLPTAPLSRGLPGIVLIDTLYNAPIVAVLTGVGVASADPALEEAATLLGASPMRRFRDVWGAPALVGAAAASALTFALSALAFAAPLVVGGPSQYTVEARVWSLDQQLVAPGDAAVVAGLGLLLLIVPAAVYVALLGRVPGGDPSRSAARPGRPGRRPIGGFAVAALGVLAALLAVELGVIASAVGRIGAPGTPSAGGSTAVADLFGPTVTAHLGWSTLGALGNSGVFAATAAGIAVLLGLALAYGGRSFGLRARRWLTALPFLSVLVSPIVLALALVRVWGPTLGSERSVWLLIVLSQAALALPFVLSALRLSLDRVPRAIPESAVVLGARPGYAFLDLELPAARRGIAGAALLGLAVGLGEFSATFFLAPPRYATATVELYRLGALRWGAESWALGGVLAVVTGVVLVFAAAAGAHGER